METQSITPSEYVFVDSGSSDNTVAIFPEGGKVHKYVGKDFNYAEALNQGICHVSTETVLIISSHTSLTNKVLERCLDLCRTWEMGAWISHVAATLGAAYALAGRADVALPLVAGAVEEFRRGQNHYRPAFVLLGAGTTYLSAGPIEEAAGHAREAVALTRRLGARGSEAHALCLVGDVASTGGAEDAEGYYREALALAGELGMRPLVAHCHLGLAKLYRRTGGRQEAQEHLTTATTMYGEMDMRFWLKEAAAEMASHTPIVGQPDGS
jgi:tetratricopeptide (TPR) repeat protein